MKHYIILLFAIISFSCKAQQTVPLNSDYLPYLKNNNYIKDLNGDLNKFVGTWKWTDPTNSNTYFEIIFFKVLHWNANNFENYYKDEIFGNYKYVENGVVITDTFGRTNYNDMYSANFPVMYTNSDKPLFNNLRIIMRDIAKNNKSCKANFEINLPEVTNPNAITAKWELISTDQIRIGNNLPVIEQGFSIPMDLTLTKQ